MSKDVILTQHARERMRLRNVFERWVVEAALTPEWTAPEPRHPGAERRFRSVPDFGGRVLRVVCAESDGAVRVITVTWDRGARRNP